MVFSISESVFLGELFNVGSLIVFGGVIKLFSVNFGVEFWSLYIVL